MDITLTPQAEAALKSLMAVGVSADEAIEQALREKAERDVERAAIQAGIDDMEAGRVRPFAEFDSEFRARHGIPADA